jgi:hypothetical protein
MKSPINVNNISSKIEQISSTTWIVTLEEDTVTGDLIMPIPNEALDANGWKVGDTLTWDIDNAGTAILTRDVEFKSGS